MPFAKLGNLSLYYDVHGQGERIILLHGAFGTGQRHWGPQIKAFSKHFQVVVPDLRGHGRSNNPSDSVTIIEVANDVASLAAHLGFGTVNLCGFSFGAAVALRTTVKYPNLVKALVLWGANYRGDKKFFEAIEREHASLLKSDYAGMLRKEHAHVYGENYFDRLATQLRDEAYARRDLPVEELRSVKAPTLICMGDQDNFVSLEQALEMRQAISNSQLFIAPGCGHFLNPKMTDLFNDLVIEFLRERPR